MKLKMNSKQYLVEIHSTAQILVHTNNLKIRFSSIQCAKHKFRQYIELIILYLSQYTG